MKKTNSSTQNMTATQKIAERRRAKEAKVRRKVNEDWQRIESTGKYRKAATRGAGRNTTDRIAGEVLDGIFLSLNARNDEKSVSVQKRLLRRIVEKRQENSYRDQKQHKQIFGASTSLSICLLRRSVYLSTISDISIKTTRKRKNYGNDSSDSSRR